MFQGLRASSLMSLYLPVAALSLSCLSWGHHYAGLIDRLRAPRTSGYDRPRQGN